MPRLKLGVVIEAGSAVRRLGTKRVMRYRKLHPVTDDMRRIIDIRVLAKAGAFDRPMRFPIGTVSPRPGQQYRAATLEQNFIIVGVELALARPAAGRQPTERIGQPIRQMREVIVRQNVRSLGGDQQVFFLGRR